MYKEVWKEYKKGFKFLLPFILVLVLFESVTDNFSFSTINFFGGSFSAFKDAAVNNLDQVSIGLFLGSVFYPFLMVVMKALVNEGEVNYRESLKESLSLYLRYLTLNIVTSAILIGIMLLGFLPIVMPIALILLMLVNALLIPCSAYLIYYHASIKEALKKGMLIGKKYFSEIFLLSISMIIIGTIILGIMSGIMSLANIDIKTNPAGNVLTNVINVIIMTYLYMYIVDICKKEEKIQGKILSY